MIQSHQGLQFPPSSSVCRLHIETAAHVPPKRSCEFAARALRAELPKHLWGRLGAITSDWGVLNATCTAFNLLSLYFSEVGSQQVKIISKIVGSHPNPLTIYLFMFISIRCGHVKSLGHPTCTSFWCSCSTFFGILRPFRKHPATTRLVLDWSVPRSSRLVDLRNHHRRTFWSTQLGAAGLFSHFGMNIQQNTSEKRGCSQSIS